MVRAPVMGLENILTEGSVSALQDLYTSKELSITEAVAFFLARIEAVNRKGPSLNAVKTIASDAVQQARIADAEIAAGRARGPLHGIPVLLKDNILTADGMTASAGAAALQSFVPEREATLVTLLRRAGAIILGKTNLTEFADYVSEVMPSGYSGAGGMVINPHNAAFGRGQGSSVGSAAAVAAGLAPVVIGSETQNSIQTPATMSSIFGYKPSLGMVSRAGIFPLVPNQDSPGPLTRCAEDAALVVSALAVPDIRDGHSMNFPRRTASVAEPISIAEVKIGVPRGAITDRTELEPVMAAFENALSKLSKAGARIMDPCDLPSAAQLQEVTSSVFRTEFKAALNCFLEYNGSPSNIDSLETLIAWNEAHPDTIPYGQGLLEAAEATNGLADQDYMKDRARDILLSRTEGIDAAIRLGVDILMTPMTVLAKCTGKAGAPVLAVPLGADAAGGPIGVTLSAPLGHDAVLLRSAAAVAGVIAGRLSPHLAI